MKKLKTNSTIATILGALVAIANAWITIDWETFEISRDWNKLALSGIIALGGYFSVIKSPKKLDV